ncbi:MAG: hypothetical protein AAFW70_00440 [Cyanobacteria bacterium J06635_10]
MKPLNLSQVNFTKRADVFNSGSGIFNPAGSDVKTLRGADQIIGNQSLKSAFGFEVFANAVAINAGAISAADISAAATVNTDGIENKGSIATNRGRDVVRGTATAEVIASANAVSNAIAYANKLDTGAIAATFANVNVDAIANGINNSGKIGTGRGSDSVDGELVASLTAVATAEANGLAIVEGIAKAPVNQSLIAFADAIAVSLANASIIATGIKNVGGEIVTGKGGDTISAIATSDSNTLSEATARAGTAATPENEAIATTVAVAIAEAQDTAIAIDNTQGIIRMGSGKDTITATATGSESYGIFGGTIQTGDGADTVDASSFGGGVNIKMGKGKDFVEGFGDATVNGGNGFDILSLDSNSFEDFNISLGGNNNKVNFEQNGIIMDTTRFEQFNFSNGSFTYDELVAKL